jgi:hypothetical protein
VLKVRESMMLQLDCSDLSLSYAWIDNKKTGPCGGQSFTVVNPDLIVTATSLGGGLLLAGLLVVRRSWMLLGQVDWAVGLG